MRNIFFLIILFCFNSCYQKSRHCNDFKVGTFKSEVIINDTLYSSDFTRTDNLQIEIYDGKMDSSEVRWINDCEVIFKTIRPKNRIEKKNVHLKILSTTDSSYTFEYSYLGESKKQKGTAFKIE